MTRGADAKFTSKRTHPLAFDESGVADMVHFYGFWPLAYHVLFTMSADRELSVKIRLREGDH